MRTGGTLLGRQSGPPTIHSVRGNRRNDRSHTAAAVTEKASRPTVLDLVAREAVPMPILSPLAQGLFQFHV